MSDMSKAAFVIAFDGPAIVNDTMDVRDLAPALLSLTQMIDAANRALNGDAIPARVQARAVSAGCFEVSLEVVLNGWQALKDFLRSDDVESAKALLEWIGMLGGAGGGLFALYRTLGGRRPDKIERDGTVLRLTIDGQTIIVPQEVLRLYQDIAVNKAVHKMLDTLDDERVTRIEFRSMPGARPEQTITSRDRQSFALAGEGDKPLTDITRQMALSIRSLAFAEGNKWRLFDGQNNITATIEDDDFLARIDRNEIRFAKSDILVCDVRTIQRETGEGLKTEHFVKRVIEHRPAPRQIEIF
jgi:hypothetical protein